MSQTVFLGDYINIKSGKSRPKEKGCYVVYGGNGIFDTAPKPNMNEPAVIVGRVGAYCGSVYIEKKPFWLSDNALGITAKNDTDLDFIYYLLKSIDLNNKSVGGAQPLLTQGILNSVKVTIPDPEIQKKIASDLRSLDEKIELNRRMNETLEKMGQALFRHYFITNPKVKNWTTGKVEDVLSALESGARPKGGAVSSGVPSVGAENIEGPGKYDYSKEKFVSEEFFERANRGKIKSEDVLLYKDGAYVGKKSLFMDDFPHKKCMVNEHVFILRTNENLKSQFYLYYWLDQPKITDQIISNGVKAAQPGLNQSGVKGLPILIPPAADVARFDDTVRPIMGRIFANSNENRTLTNLHDTLLPRLISGKIKP